MSIRMRLGATHGEILRDTLDFSEMCRMNDLAASEDILLWMKTVCKLPILAELLENKSHPSRKVFAKAVDSLNLVWFGKRLSCEQSIWTCSQYVSEDSIIQPWLSLVSLAPQMNELNRVWKLFQVGETWTNDKGPEVTELLSWSFDYIHNLIKFREVLSKDCTTLAVHGKHKDGQGRPGIIHQAFLKHDMMKVIKGLHIANRRKLGVSDEDAPSGVWEKLGNPEAFRQNFAPTHYDHLRETGEDLEENELGVDNGGKGQSGLAHHCSDKFNDYTKTLTEGMEIQFANILFELHCTRFDDIICDIAGQHMVATTTTAKLHAITAALYGDRKAAGGGNNSELAVAFAAFQEAFLSKPISAEKGNYQEENLLTDGAQIPILGDDGGEDTDTAEHKEKKEIAAGLKKWREKAIMMHSPEDGTDVEFHKTERLNSMLLQTNFHKDRTTPSTKRAWVVSMDMFSPMVQAWASERKDKDFLATHAALLKQQLPKEVNELLVWIFGHRMADRDWVIFVDGRFSRASLTWLNAIDRAHIDWGLVEETRIAYNDYGESDFRTSQRRLAFADNKSEKMFFVLPTIKRSAMTAKPRSSFNACGEESSFDRQYSGVAMRSLSEIPMLSDIDAHHH